MTLDKDRPRVGNCTLCDKPMLRVLKLQTEHGEIVVGRCLICDTAPCPKCEGRTLCPTATECVHCGADIVVAAPKKRS